MSEKSLSSKIDLVMEMEKTAGDGDWEHLKSFFTDDVLFKVGASQERRGNRAIIDYWGWMFSMLELNPPFEFRGTWEQRDVVIIQVDAKFTRRSDGKPITLPSVDVVRFDGDKIREWRVYTDQTELFSDEGRVKLHSSRRYA